jgi:hypothetical protein
MAALLLDSCAAISLMNSRSIRAEAITVMRVARGFDPATGVPVPKNKTLS